MMQRRFPMLYVLNDQHEVVALDMTSAEAVQQWADWMYGFDHHVGLTDLLTMQVSTVFVGTDLGIRHDPPILFETAVLHGRPELGVKVIARYATWQEAEQGHAECVAAMMSTADEREARRRAQ